MPLELFNNLIFMEFVKIVHNCSCLDAKWYTSADASGFLRGPNQVDVVETIIHGIYSINGEVDQ